MDIQFEEGNSFTSTTYYTKRTCVPVYMVKGGKKYFVQSKLLFDADPLWGNYEVKKSAKDIAFAKEFLTAHDGKYLVMCGKYADPLDMLKNMSDNGYTFTTPDSMFMDCRENGGFVDFHGNMCEVSAAFRYRIYDDVLLKDVYAAAKPLILKSSGNG